MKKQIVVERDLMQIGYVYFLTEQVAKNFHSEFRPQLSPKEMLKLGVFGGLVSWMLGANLFMDFHEFA